MSIMKKSIHVAVSLILVASLLVVETGCNSQITANSFKAYFQLATGTFIAAESVANPQWNSGKLAADVSGLISVWNVGTDWETNAIVELVSIQGDIADIPSCSPQCQALSIVFLGAAATGIAIAQANQPIKAAVQAKVKRAGVATRGKVYTDWKAYKASWNAVAPAGHKL